MNVALWVKLSFPMALELMLAWEGGWSQPSDLEGHSWPQELIHGKAVDVFEDPSSGFL